MPTLLCKIGDSPVERHVITRESVVIGRAESADLRIDDPAVSRVHCQVSRMPSGSWLLQDFGSRNRTYLDGEPVTEHELIHGDVFTVGPARIAFSGTPVQGERLPGGTTLPVDIRDDLALADSGTRAGTPASFGDEPEITEELAAMASGEMTMVPDDPIRALADDATHLDAGECPMCGKVVLPGKTYCGPCDKRLEAQRQAMQLRTQDKPSFWKRLFGQD